MKKLLPFLLLFAAFLGVALVLGGLALWSVPAALIATGSLLLWCVAGLLTLAGKVQQVKAANRASMQAKMQADLKARARAAFGDETRWAEVM